MKVYLTYPPESFNIGWGGVLPFPMGSVSLASYLIERGVATKIYHDEPYRLNDFLKLIDEFKPDVVGMTCDSSNHRSCFKISQFIKKIDNEILVILGGIHATFFDEIILKKIPTVDIIVRGEGEATLSEILPSLKKSNDLLRDVAGITFRSKNEVFRNPDRPFIADLDSLPFLKYDLVDMKRTHSGTFLDWWPLHTGRGCRFACKYCADVSLWKRVYRFKSSGRVLDELRACQKKYHCKGFLFNDLTFTTNRMRVFELCRKLIEEKMAIRWGCYTRIDCVDKKLLEIMAASGCQLIVYGVESFSDKMLKLMGKGYRIEKAVHMLNYTNTLGIDTRFELLLGFPGETKDTLKETIMNLKQLDKGVIYNNINKFKLHPGSIIYNIVQKKGLVNAESWFSGFRMERFTHIFYSDIFMDFFNKTIEEIRTMFKEEYMKKKGSVL